MLKIITGPFTLFHHCRHNNQNVYKHLLIPVMMTSNSSIQTTQKLNYVIEHFKAEQEFRMKTDYGTALVQYTQNENVLDLTESFVPELLRGKGIGRILAKGTFDQIEQDNLKIKLTCTFLRKFYEENKNRYKHLVLQ